MKKNSKKYLVIFTIVLLVFASFMFVSLGIGTIYGVVTGLSERSKIINWKDNTTPISPEIVDDLCDKFEISSDEPVCKPNTIVYGPDFYPYIIKSFCPEKDRCVSLAEVEEKIGKYKYSEDAQDALMPNESNRYWYDFQSDHRYPLIISFNKDGTIEQIQYNFGD